jgi:tight adherence protein B
MTGTVPIIILLALLVFAALVTLWLDSRQRLMDRQLEIAMSTSELAKIPSIRRKESASRWQLIYRLANYRPGIRCGWHPAYVLLVGACTAVAILYANRLFAFSTFYVLIGAGVAALWTVRSLFAWQRHRLSNLLLRQLPDAIQLVTSTVRSGLPVNEAFRTIARDMPQPTAGQFAIVCSEMNMGTPADEAMEAVFQRTQVAEYAMFAVTLAVQLKSGGSLAETLQTLADTVTQRVAMAGRAKALAGEVIFSSRALSLAPVIVGGLLYLVNPQSIDLLFTDPTGNTLLAYAVGSVLLGHFVIRWMIRRETAL